MVQVIRDLWVLTKYGTVLFSRIFDQKLNPDLFGAFMSAIMSFSKELSPKGGLTNFILIKTQYTILKSNNLVFVGNSAAHVKRKKINHELKIISEKFFNKYSQEFIEDYKGKVSIFDGFIKEIDDSLERPIDRLQKSFW